MEQRDLNYAILLYAAHFYEILWKLLLLQAVVPCLPFSFNQYAVILLPIVSIDISFARE